jgi:hypothetical protein
MLLVACLDPNTALLFKVLYSKGKMWCTRYPNACQKRCFVLYMIPLSLSLEIRKPEKSSLPFVLFAPFYQP